jgi:protein-L-isoaspartate O-methyltransferase
VNTANHSQARSSMAARLTALTGMDSRWQAAFAQVPRDAFLPETVWHKVRGRAARIERESDPDAWWSMVYDERQTIITQLDEGTPDGPGHFTSSSTMPLVMAQMLALLPERGRVLEIGTGTGYNAALLAHRYGPGGVVTVEVDEQLAASARAALIATGYPVTVVRADGIAPAPVNGEFDAVIATCAIRSLPEAWLTLCPNGRLVLPYATRWSDVAALVLDTHDATRATGRFYPGFVFMDARTQAPADDRPRATVGGRTRISTLPPAEVTWQQPNAAFAIGLLMPGVDYRSHTDEGISRVTLWDAHGSWAVIDQERSEEGWYVRESGRRELWAEVEDAYRRWARWQYPSPDRFGAEIDSGAMRLFLDEPAHRIATLELATARSIAA